MYIRHILPYLSTLLSYDLHFAQLSTPPIATPSLKAVHPHHGRGFDTGPGYLFS
jgi:hypothetical protein